MNPERKTRGDSVIDTALSGAEQEAFFAYLEGTAEAGTHTLAEGQAWLLDRKQIELSRQAISTWAAARRKEAADLKFRALLADIGEDARRAQEFGETVGALQIAGITQSNVAMLSQALFRAQRDRDVTSIEFFTNLLATLLSSVAKQQAGVASVISAETARDRFQFDAARRALEHAADLQQINEDAGHQRDKIERAIVRLFGQRAGNLPMSPTVAGRSDVSNPPLAGKPSNQSAVSSNVSTLTSNVSDLTYDVSLLTSDVSKEVVA